MLRKSRPAGNARHARSPRCRSSAQPAALSSLLDEDVGDVRAGQELGAVRGDDLVVLGRDDVVADARHGVAALVELGDEGRAGDLVGEAGGRGADDVLGAGEVRQELGEAEQGGAVVVGGDADEGVHLLGPAEELEVPAGHHAALRVPDEVGLGGAGGGEDAVDVGVELSGGRGDGAEPVEEGDARQLAVVEGEDAVAPVDQVGREGEPVVDGVPEGAVDEDDGARVRGGRLAGEVVPATAGGGAGLGGGGGGEGGGGGQEEHGQRSERVLPGLRGQHRAISLRLKGMVGVLCPAVRTTSGDALQPSYARVASAGKLRAGKKVLCPRQTAHGAAG